MQITLNSNIGVELEMGELTKAVETNKVKIQYHYPPLKSKVRAS